MDREFDEHRPSRNVKYRGADIDNAPTKLEPLLKRAAATELHEDHRDSLQTVFAEVEQVVLAEFGDPNVGPPQLRLH
jgi:hypothetical protein